MYVYYIMNVLTIYVEAFTLAKHIGFKKKKNKEDNE